MYCAAHTLNFVVQDAWQNVVEIRNFLEVLKDLVNFIRGSPKRLGEFSSVQSEISINEEALKPFCPTRWCLRVKAVKSLLSNYEVVLIFLDKVSETDKSGVGAKASGFLKSMKNFEYYLFLSIILTVFEKVENLNKYLQNSSLNFSAVETSVEHLIVSLRTQRSEEGFANIWKDAVTQSKKINLKEPRLGKKKKNTH